MPIPIQPLPEERALLRLVESNAPARPKAQFTSRTLAHLMDLCVVQGFSLYSAKLGSLALVSGHMKEIQDSGKFAGGIFREAFQYGNWQVFFACLTLFSFLYFVGMPYVLGRTFGLGVFGLKLENAAGTNPTMKQLITRLATYAASFASLGLLFVVGLRRRDGRFLHDQISETRIVKA